MRDFKKLMVLYNSIIILSLTVKENIFNIIKSIIT